LGHCSDRKDRRLVLAWVAALAAGAGLLLLLPGTWGAVLGAFLFGSLAFAVYPIVVAHLIDHLPREEILSGNVGLLLLHGAGAAVGPLGVGVGLAALGSVALPLHFLFLFGALAVLAWRQVGRCEDEIIEDPAHFMPMLRTSSAVLEMMTPAASEPEPESVAGPARE